MQHASDARLTRASLARLDNAIESGTKDGIAASGLSFNYFGSTLLGDALNSRKRSAQISPDMSLFLGKEVAVNKRRRTERSSSSSRKASAGALLPHDNCLSAMDEREEQGYWKPGEYMATNRYRLPCSSSSPSSTENPQLLIDPLSSLMQPQHGSQSWTHSLPHEQYSFLRLLDSQRDASLAHVQVPRVGSSAHINRLVAEYAPLEESSDLILNIPSRVPSLTPGFNTPLSSPPHSISQVYHSPAWLTSSMPSSYPSQVAAMPHLPVAPPFLSSCTPSSSEALDSRPVTPKRASSQLPAVQDATSPISQVSNLAVPAAAAAAAAVLHAGGVQEADLADLILPAVPQVDDKKQGLCEGGKDEEVGHAELDDMFLLRGDSWQISGSTRRAMEQWLHEGQGTTEGGASEAVDGEAMGEGEMVAANLNADVGPFDWLEDLVGGAAAAPASDDVPGGSNPQQQQQQHHQVLPQWILEELEEDGVDWEVVERGTEGEVVEEEGQDMSGDAGQEEKPQSQRRLVRTDTSESSTAGAQSFASARSSLRQSSLSPQESRKGGGDEQEGGKTHGGMTIHSPRPAAGYGPTAGGGNPERREKGEAAKPWEVSVGSVEHAEAEEGFGESEGASGEGDGEGEGEVAQPFERSFSTEWMKDLMNDPSLFGSFAEAAPAEETGAGEEGSNKQVAGSDGPISVNKGDEWAMAAFLQTLEEGFAGSSSSSRSINGNPNDNTISVL